MRGWSRPRRARARGGRAWPHDRRTDGLVVVLLAPDFVDIAGEAGLRDVASGRAVFVDLDADGRLDVVLNREHFFLQRAGKFVKTEGLPYVAHFGLGRHTTADRVEVFRSDRAGQTTVRRGVPADRRLRVAQ